MSLVMHLSLGLDIIRAIAFAMGKIWVGMLSETCSLDAGHAYWRAETPQFV